MQLETPRLLLRDFNEQDIERLIECLNDPEISKNLKTVPFPFTRECAESWIRDCEYHRKSNPRILYDFALQFKENPRLIGEVGLVVESNKPEIYYWIAREHWEQGLATEAARELIKFGFEYLDFREINLTTFEENPPSNNLASKLGFKFERRTKLRSRATGMVYDSNVFKLKRK